MQYDNVPRQLCFQLWYAMVVIVLILRNITTSGDTRLALPYIYWLKLRWLHKKNNTISLNNNGYTVHCSYMTILWYLILHYTVWQWLVGMPEYNVHILHNVHSNHHNSCFIADNRLAAKSYTVYVCLTCCMLGNTRAVQLCTLHIHIALKLFVFFNTAIMLSKDLKFYETGS